MMSARTMRKSLLWVRSVTPMRWPSAAGKRSRQRIAMSASVESWTKVNRSGTPAMLHSSNTSRASCGSRGSQPATPDSGSTYTRTASVSRSGHR